MPIYRINKKSKYTTIDNNIFLNKELSFKATGLLVTMLSLPDDWDFSEMGLSTLKKDNLKSIKTALKELEDNGYLIRNRNRDEQGRLREIIYDVYEEPICHFQTLEKPMLEKPTLEKDIQLNTNIINNLNNKELNNKKENIKERFKKPTLEEVEEYVKERNSSVNPRVFFDYYEVNDWKDIKNWKQKLITWETHQRSNKQETKETLPYWFNNEPTKSEISEEEEREFKELLNSFN